MWRPETPVFVTGATGFIGDCLVQQLVRNGLRVRVLSRQVHPERPPGWNRDAFGPLEHESVELVVGDITDPEAVMRGMSGCRHVFHLAGYAKNWAADARTFYRVNVEGAEHVFEAAQRLDVERVVWTSTIVTFGPTPAGVVGDEEMRRTTDRYFTDYEASKTMAENKALLRAAAGLPLVIVNPTRVYGPGHLTEGNSLARLINDYDRGKVPCLLNRGVNIGNYVLVDDVVQGLLLAMERGRIGQRYILGGTNVSLREFFDIIDHVSGKRHRQIPLLRFGLLLYSYALLKRAEWFGTYPRITPGWIRTFLVDWAYSSEKAQAELGYHPTPLEDGIRSTYHWLCQLREGAS